MKDNLEVESEEVVETEVRKTAYIHSKDWLGRNNFFSRAIIVAVIVSLLYAFFIKDAALAGIAAWLIIAIFLLISVGINSLKMIIDAIVKIRAPKD